MKEPNSFDYILATKLAAETSDAYSYNRYGVDEWFKCIWFLVEYGYTNEAIETILRSKTMRWAADGNTDGKYEGTVDSLRRYHDENTGYIQQDLLVDECGISQYMRVEENAL